MYAKVFLSIFYGSMRGKSDMILVFVNLLTHADQDGIVDITHQVVSDETGLDMVRTKAAIKQLESPDPASRSDEHEGVRIRHIDEHREWGWEIVNYVHYRDLCTQQDRRNYMKQYMIQRRKKSVNKSLTNVNLLSVSVSASDSSLILSEGQAIKEFEECWALYPEKSGKNRALAAYVRAMKNGCDQGKVLSGINRYIQYVKDKRVKFPELKFKNGSTWFNQQCWEDEYTTTHEGANDGMPIYK